MTALGFIETKGLLAAVEGADAMLKAADVRLLERHIVGGGLVSVTIAGEVSAVRASVDAAVAAIGRIDGAVLVSEHVIARPDEGVARIIATEPTAEATTQEAFEVFVEEPAVKQEPVAETVAEEPPAEKGEGEEISDQPERYTVSRLRKMKVDRLRQLARALEGLSLTGDEIKSATKKSLIEAIVNAYGQREE